MDVCELGAVHVRNTHWLVRLPRDEPPLASYDKRIELRQR